MPKATHYEILKVGSEPNKRFLQKTMNGVHWTSQGYAHKFSDLANAVKEQRQHENCYIIWIGVHADGQKGWGEVNRDHIARTY
jgi:hypothetical protein